MTHINQDKQEQEEISPHKVTISHEVFSSDLLLKGEDKDIFQDFKANLLTEIVPLTKMEEYFAEKFIFSAWELRRLKLIEKSTIDGKNVPEPTEKDLLRYALRDDEPRKRIRTIRQIHLTDPEVEKIHAHAVVVERDMYKALKKLQELQRIRKSGGLSNPPKDEGED